MKIRKRLKLLLWSLIFLAFLKIGFLTLLLGNQIASLEAKEKIPQYSCPPEFSEYLLVEKERLRKEAEKLEARKKELSLLEKRVKEQIAVLKDLENTIDEKLKKIEVIYDRRFKLLVKAFSEMRAAKAAALLLNMDQDMALKILSQLKSSQVASILSAMPPEKAAALSEALSGAPPRKY
jgi:flagellar motility protein MotE (MotC chaperone)